MTFSRRPGARFNRGRIPTGSSSGYPNFTALGAAFWIDASNPASYTASGANLTSIKSLVSGTALSTIVGAPQIITDPRDGQAAFSFPVGAGECVMGADATYIAAVTGTNKPFCSIIVFELGLPTLTACVDSVQDSGNTGNGQYFLSASGNWYLERDAAPSGPARIATSEKVQAGLCVVVQSSSDGLTVRTSINGAAETSAAAFLSAGALSPNRVGIGIHASSAQNFPWFGTIRERAYFGANKTFAEYSPWVASLMAKWVGTTKPCVYFVGDSITTAQNATNGGMVTLLSQRMRSLGLYADPIGPLAAGQAFPYRHSAASGNTCAQMNTRILDNSLGLGQGGASAGHYRRAKLVCLFAGTNDVATDPTATNYGTLLDNVYARMIQAQPNGRIAVTPITDINGSTAAVNTYNAAMAAKHATFEAAHPGVLIYWDALNAAPWNATDYVDTTHPGNTGYEKLVDNATYGLLQAVLPYLTSIQ